MTRSTSRAGSDRTGEVLPEVVIARAPGALRFRPYVAARLAGQILDGRVVTDPRLADGGRTIYGRLSEKPRKGALPASETLF